MIGIAEQPSYIAMEGIALASVCVMLARKTPSQVEGASRDADSSEIGAILEGETGILYDGRKKLAT